MSQPQKNEIIFEKREVNTSVKVEAPEQNNDNNLRMMNKEQLDNHIERINAKKTNLCNLPYEKKLLKLALFSSCRVSSRIVLFSSSWINISCIAFLKQFECAKEHICK